MAHRNFIFPCILWEQSCSNIEYGIKINLIRLLKIIRNVHVKYIYRKNIIMQEELDQNLSWLWIPPIGFYVLRIAIQDNWLLLMLYIFFLSIPINTCRCWLIFSDCVIYLTTVRYLHPYACLHLESVRILLFGCWVLTSQKLMMLLTPLFWVYE